MGIWEFLQPLTIENKSVTNHYFSYFFCYFASKYFTEESWEKWLPNGPSGIENPSNHEIKRFICTLTIKETFRFFVMIFINLPHFKSIVDRSYYKGDNLSETLNLLV